MNTILIRSSCQVTHAGRGGAGNIRSPSRDPKDAIYEAKEDALQAQLVAKDRGRRADAPFSSGRGGAGNISRSQSRSRSQARNEVHATGRGGWGNIAEEPDRDSISLEKVCEQHFAREPLMDQADRA